MMPSNFKRAMESLQSKKPDRLPKKSKMPARTLTQYLRVCKVCGDETEMGDLDVKEIRVFNRQKSPIEGGNDWFIPVKLPCGHRASTAHYKIVPLPKVTS